jgi:hypothetical protein
MVAHGSRHFDPQAHLLPLLLRWVWTPQLRPQVRLFELGRCRPLDGWVSRREK